MSDLISKSALLKLIPCEEIAARMVVSQMPTIDVPDRKVGKWMPYEFGDYHWHKCSVCGKADRYIDTVDRSDRGYGKRDLESIRNFCPYCGADMRERSKE